MTNYWIVTSAIHDVGVFSKEERFHQTILTINSIRKHSQNNHIILAEGSPQELVGPARRVIQYMCDDYLDVWYQDKFQNLCHMPVKNPQYTKSNQEAYLIQEVLHTRLAQVVQPSDRIFKLSGRYQLNKLFDPHAHETATGAWCTAAAQPPACVDVSKAGQVPTRCYSVCGRLLQEYMQVSRTVSDLLLAHHTRNKWLDLEHAMFEVLIGQKVIQLNPLGVEGNYCYCGQQVRD